MVHFLNAYRIEPRSAKTLFSLATHFFKLRKMRLFIDVYQALPTPDLKMLSIDLTFISSIVHAPQKELKEKHDIDVSADVIRRWRESLKLKIELASAE